MSLSSAQASLSRDFYEFVRLIGEAKSKQEEDRLILRELAYLKTQLGTPRMSKKNIREIVMRVIHAEMLGHEASVGYMKAVELCASPDILSKRIGYLACGLVLSPEHEFRVMLVNQLGRDLVSKNRLEVCTALVGVSWLVNADMIPALISQVIGLLDHDSEVVRKKAVRCASLQQARPT